MGAWVVEGARESAGGEMRGLYKKLLNCKVEFSFLWNSLKKQKYLKNIWQ